MWRYHYSCITLQNKAVCLYFFFFFLFQGQQTQAELPSCHLQPVVIPHKVKFVSYGAELMGVILMVPTALTEQAWGLRAVNFEGEWRVG